MTNEIKTIGFIGVGTMGRGMIQNLAKNGFSVLAYNRTKSKIEDLASEKIKIVDSVEKTGDGNVVITCLPSDDSFQKAVLDSDLLSKLENRILVDCGTTSIDMTEKISNSCKEKNVDFLDAPITGSRLGAEGGTLTIMVGGRKELYERCIPVFEAMGKVHVYCGPVTYGQRAKLPLQLAQALILESYLESIILGLKSGVPLKALQEIMENSGARSNIGVFKLNTVKKRDFEQHFMLKLMYKDLVFVEKEMKRLNLDLPLAKHAREIFEESLNRGDEDVSTIVRELEKQAGVEIKE